ncbi:MAG: hypothetical protein WC785_05140 [Tatlockia sp.]
MQTKFSCKGSWVEVALMEHRAIKVYDVNPVWKTLITLSLHQGY